MGWLVLVRAEAAHAANVGAAVELDEQRCVTLDAVRAAAALRGGHVDADSPVRLRVHVREAEPPSAVTLVITGEGAHGAIEARTIVADSCAEAASALGLVVTMAGEDEQAPVEAPRAEPPSLTPPATPSQGTARELSPTSTAPPARPSRATARETPRATKLYTALGLVATPLYVGPTGARLSGGIASDRVLFPWAELSVGATLPRTVLGGGAAVNLTWLTARASLAPLGASLGDQRSPRAAKVGGVAPAAAPPTHEEPALPAKAEPAVAPAAEPAPRAAASLKNVAPAPQGTGLARQVPSSIPAATAVPAVDSLPREPRSEQVAQPPAAPTSVLPNSVLSDELRLIDAARAALQRGDVPLALRLTAEHAARFPGGSLAIERDVLRVDALVAGGRIAEAASHACAFVARSPRSAQAPRMIKVGRCSNTIP